MLLIDIENKYLTMEERELLSHPLVSGIVLFSRNFESRSQLQDLIRSIRTQVKKTLLITVDQEGGRVQRFRDGFTLLPAMQALSVAGCDLRERQQLAFDAGWVMAAEMFAMDIDLSFAPVLDLGHSCKAIGDRALGKFHYDVIPLAESFIDGMRKVGMATTGKHFPGHGSVLVDSHLETPIDDRSFDEIIQHDLQPFIHLIGAKKLSAVMPAHVIYAQCDIQPASGSSFWLKYILRQKFRFNGVIFSDDLGMKGAESMGNYLQRCQQSLMAGCDLLLLCNSRSGVIEVLDNFVYDQSLLVHPHLNLMKKQQLAWNDLTHSRYWQEVSKRLTQLQMQWLERKNSNEK